MLANYKLYWDPKGNRLFIPTFETKAIGETQPRSFTVKRFGPCDFLVGNGKNYPSFEAVHLASFGTWGLVGYARGGILKDFTGLKGPKFTNKGVRANFQKFVEDHPEFKDTRFAFKEECVYSIPVEAIYTPKA